jgi:GTPase SAR1 family protein
MFLIKMPRKAHHIIITGTNGTGKTTLLRQIVKEAIVQGRRALIITPDPVEWRDVEEIQPDSTLLRRGGFMGVKKIVYFSESETLSPISDHYFDGLLIFDDCRAYFGANTHPILKKIFIRRRQNMRDIIIVAHGFTDIPPQYYTYTTMFILFKTVDNIQKRKSTIVNYEKIKIIVERVNKKALINEHYKEIINV